MDSDIYIVPVGDMNEKLLYPLIPILEKRFTTNVYLALDKRMPLPEDAFDYDAQKYVAMYVLRELINVEVPEDAKILGVADVDLFLPEWDNDFIFGQAQYGRKSKAAIISVFRMDPFSYVGGKHNDELLIQRMIKEAIHELGHLFGVRNSAEPESVMYLPRSLRELDRKTDSFDIISQTEYRDLQRSKEELRPPK